MGKGKRNRQKRASKGVKAGHKVLDDRVSEVSLLPPNARGSELKLAHAHDHLQDINKLIQGWIHECLETVREEPDPNEAGYFCAWIDAPKIDAKRLSLLIGDSLQSFRSALDHLAFELATAFTVPMTNEIEKDSSFPILSDVDRQGNFGKGPHKWLSAQSKVRGMDPRAQATIEGLQPYKRGHAYDTDPLCVLGELNNVDKHRVLHVATRIMSGAVLNRRRMSNVRTMGLSYGQPFKLTIREGIAAEGRTLVARWPMTPIDPRQPMHMGFLPALNIVFDANTPLVAETPVSQVLGEIDNHIMSHVLPRLITYLN